MAVVSSCREMWWLSPATSATLVLCCQPGFGLGHSQETAVERQRKERMTSSPHGSYIQGYTRATMATTNAATSQEQANRKKVVSVRIAV